MNVKRTERGWAGHFVGSYHCKFRRNTLLQNDDINVVVSTIGNMTFNNEIMDLGGNRMYETMIFVAKQDGPYWDADFSLPIGLEVEWMIPMPTTYCAIDGIDNLANNIHEKNVDEVVRLMNLGEIKKYITL